MFKKRLQRPLTVLSLLAIFSMVLLSACGTSTPATTEVPAAQEIATEAPLRVDLPALTLTPVMSTQTPVVAVDAPVIQLLTPYNAAYVSDGSGIRKCGEGINVGNQVVLQFEDGVQINIAKNSDGFQWTTDKVNYITESANDSVRFQGMGKESNGILPMSEVLICYADSGIGAQVREVRAKGVDLVGTYTDLTIFSGSLETNCSMDQATDLSVYFMDNRKPATLVYVVYDDSSQSFTYTIVDLKSYETHADFLAPGNELGLNYTDSAGSEVTYKIQSCGTGVVSQ